MGDRGRFLNKVQLGDKGECWEWLGYFSGDYPMVYFEGRDHHAHRVAYQVFRGSIPRGLHAHHTCEHKWCVNPYHVELVTPRQHSNLHKEVK